MLNLYLFICTVMCFIWSGFTIFLSLLMIKNKCASYINDEEYQLPKTIQGMKHFGPISYFSDSEECFSSHFFLNLIMMGVFYNVIICFLWPISVLIFVPWGILYVLRSLKRLNKKINTISENCKNCE